MRSLCFVVRTLSCVACLLLTRTTPSLAQPLPGELQASASARGDVGAAPDQKVGEIYDAALKDLREGRHAEAYSGFSKVWSIEKKPRTAGNLGKTEMKLAMYVPAVEHLSFFLREQKGLGPEEREEVTRLLKQAKAHVGALRINVAQPGARVSIDGRAIGMAPLDEEIYVEPGRRKVEALLGERRTSTEVNATAGATTTVALDVAPAVASTVLPPPPPASPPATGTSRSLLPGLVAGGIGVVALAVGAGSLVGYADKKRESEDLHREIVGADRNCISGSVHPSCSALRDATRTGDTFHDTGIGLLVGGGVVTALSVGYLLWANTSSNRQGAGVRLNAAVSPQGAAAGVSGSF